MLCLKDLKVKLPAHNWAKSIYAESNLSLQLCVWWSLCFMFWVLCVFVHLVAQSCQTLWNPMEDSPPGSSVHGDSPGKNTRVGCHVLLQGIFPTQEANPGFPHSRQILYHLSHQGIPRILEWVAYPFSRASSRPRNWTKISCVPDRFFISWATLEIFFFFLNVWVKTLAYTLNCLGKLWFFFKYVEIKFKLQV